ncbi:hypothetical protein ILYODFUR_033000 [Ilyodon furcidens]|uniref:Uncharacterized protein n=1 Tax=Ilyodon furcidens TaxID=33524 RepID=A0ABV0UPT9_9TELE
MPAVSVHQISYQLDLGECLWLLPESSSFLDFASDCQLCSSIEYGYNIMGKTADLTAAQKTVVAHLHKEGKPQKVLNKLDVNRVLYPRI